MAAPQIAALPAPPSRSSPTNFSERADAFLGALPNFQSQANALATWLDTTSAAAVAAAETARDLALSYRNTASSHATSANSSKNAAATSATNAKTSETKAKTSETNAAGSATAAAGSASSASGSATAAAGSASAAAGSASAAKTSETNAKTSETNAKTSETNAAGSASTANTRATAAETARAAAVAAEGRAKTSETNAKTSETNAAGSASAAAGSASAAATARTGAQNALNDFDGKWYGSRTTAPTGTIAEGAMYFNTAAGGLHIRRNGAWVGAVASSFDELWALIKNSDGHNSGLDADTVDGFHVANLVDLSTTNAQLVKGIFGAVSQSRVQARDANDAAPSFIIFDDAGNEKGRLFWNRSDDTLQLRTGVSGNWNSLTFTRDGRLLHNNSRVLNTSDLDLASTGIIELNKGGSGNRNAIIDLHAQDGVDYSSRIIREPGENGNLIIANPRGTGDLSLINPYGSIKLNAGTGLLKNGSPILSQADEAANATGLNALIFARCAVACGFDVQIAGSQLTVAGLTSSGAIAVGGYTPPGTWKNVGTTQANGLGLFRRVA